MDEAPERPGHPTRNVTEQVDEKGAHFTICNAIKVSGAIVQTHNVSTNAYDADPYAVRVMADGARRAHRQSV